MRLAAFFRRLDDIGFLTNLDIAEEIKKTNYFLLKITFHLNYYIRYNTIYLFVNFHLFENFL